MLGFNYMKRLILLVCFLFVGCEIDDSELASSFLPEKMPENVIISSYREYGNYEEGDVQNLEIQVEIGGGYMKRYFLSDPSKHSEIKNFEVSFEDMELLYSKMRELKIDMITTNTDGYDGNKTGLYMYFEDQDVSVSENEIDYIDPEWKDDYDQALFEIEYFALERIEK